MRGKILFVNWLFILWRYLIKFADTLIPGLGQTCTDFLNNNMQGIIESIVHEDLDPEEVCTNFGLCP